MTSVEVAIEAYKECGITPDIQPFRGVKRWMVTYKESNSKLIYRSREPSWAI